MKRLIKHEELPRDLLTPATRHFLSRVDAIYIDSDVPTACTRIQNGKVEVMLGEGYLKDSPEHQAGTLLHEAGHWFFGTWARVDDRTATGVDVAGNQVSLWNLATDAVINHFIPPEQCNPSWITYDFLHAPIMASEALYDWMLKEASENSPLLLPSASCSNHMHGRDDGTCRSKQIADNAGLRDIDPGMLGGLKSPRVRQQASLHESQPAWLRQLLELLKNRATKGSVRMKSWSRERRGISGSLLLPGRLARPDKPSATILVDVSGSCKEIAPILLGALAHCPYLAAESMVVFFDHSIIGSCRLGFHAELTALLGTGGGGTLIAAAGKARGAGPAVWLTDAYSGDGFPDAHGDVEVWIVAGSAEAPPNGITVRA